MEPNTEVVSFMLRLSQDDAELIRAAVVKSGFTHRSEWIRHALRAAAEKVLKKT